MECLLEKIHSCQNNPEKSYTEKKTKHTPSGYSLFTNCSFDATKNKLDCYKDTDCMERFCKGLRDRAMKIINYEEKEMIPLTDKENKSYEKQKVCYICKKEFSTDENNKNAFKLYHKVRDHCHYTEKNRGAAHSICNLRYETPKEIPAVFHHGSAYDYHFIINKLSKELYGQLEYLMLNHFLKVQYVEKQQRFLSNPSFLLKFFDDAFQACLYPLSNHV